MAAAGFVIAAFKLLAGAIEEQGGQHQIITAGQLLDDFHHGMRVEAARSRIKADDQWCIGIGGQVGPVDQPFEQADGEIVDGFPAQILQRAQHRGLAGAKHAGDQQDTLLLRKGRILPRRMGGGLGNHGVQAVRLSG